jgi:nucleoside-diphosphate-sugar epimerase
MKKLLITGINGFLGSHIAKKLSAKYEIIGIEYSIENLWRLEGESFKVCTSDDVSLKNIFENHQIFAIIHAATVYRSINESILDILNTNVLLPIKLYELANKYNVSTFINTDSFFNDKKYQYSYLSEYTQSKNNALEWLKLLNVNTSCKLVNMKIFHMYGPGDALTKFIPSILLKIKENIPTLDLTEGKQTRDFIYIDDVVNAFEVILDKSNDIYSFQEFEVGTGKAVSIKEMVEFVKKLTNSSTELKFGAINYREGEIMESCAKNAELLAFGWFPQTNLKTGVLSLF